MGSKNTISVFRNEDAKTRYMETYAGMLRDWPVPFEALNVRTRVGTTHVIASGARDAPAMVLLACMMGSATAWRPNVAALSRHYRTYAIDVIGEPNKSRPERRIRSRREYADWLVDVLDAVNAERAYVVGNSYGGFLALNQCLLSPERVERAVLISPAATFVPLLWSFYFKFAIPNLLRSEKLISRGREWMRNGVELDADWNALMKIATLHGRPINFVPPKVFSREEFARVRQPVLLLIGDKEVLYDPRETLKLARTLVPTLIGEIIPNANHNGAVANPEFVNDRVIRFCAEQLPNNNLKSDAATSARLLD